MSDLIERIAELKKQGRSFCIATVVAAEGATPRKAGARALIFPDGSLEGTVGGGNIELQAIQIALQVLNSQRPLLQKFELEELEVGGMICGGSMTLFFEPVLPDRMLTIFGGGHVGRSVARVAHEAGWKVRVVDEREGVLDPQWFPQQAELIVKKYLDFIHGQNFGPNDWLVIVTPKHGNDEQVLQAVIHSDAAYIGMMGSPKKVAEVMNNLKSRGISPEILEKAFAPIGLNIASQTPGEIAVSIVAEMLAVLNQVKQIKSFSLKEEH
ncbi:MAG: XdhC family protein [candidate division KSB1 bacterium]|nr:XdhC family protein [candidate division KSB1 bacterium]